jgi:putative transposase
MRWHRRLVAQKWDFSKRRGPGRPGIMREISQLIVRMARENPGWGYTRIQGALANLNHKVPRGTVSNVLKRNGIDPSPERGKRTAWSTFLRAHWKVLAASDFFTVEVWTPRGLPSSRPFSRESRLSRGVICRPGPATIAASLRTRYTPARSARR